MRTILFLSLCLMVAAEEEGSWEGGSVVMLGDADFAEYRAKNPKFLAAFFAPWCGHCKHLKPEFAAAADSLQFRVPLVAVDCTEDGKETCNKFDVKGFPTVVWFDGESQEKYEKGRTTADIIAFIDEKIGNEPENFDGVDFNTLKIKQLKRILFDRGQACPGCTERRDFVKRVQETIHLPKKGPAAKGETKKFEGTTLVNGRTFAQERRWKAAKAVAEKGWEEGNGKVVHAVEDDFPVLLAEKKNLFVMFYAPWCGHCKSFKPIFAEASETSPVTLVSLDCDTNQELCRKHGATGYPTLKLYKDGDAKGITFDGSRSNAKGVLKWINKKLSNDPDAPEEWTNEKLWGDDNGEVAHLTAGHWAEYRKTHPKIFVMFYAPWCGHCKALKPDWGKASEKVKALPFVGVDCTENGELCVKYGVKGYPTILYFDSSSDEEGESYDQGRTLDDLVKFAQSKIGKADL